MSPEDFVIRDASAEDVPAIAQLHVTTFNETHCRPGGHGPTYEVRESQWREAFEKADGTWFCVAVQRPDGELVGFAKGVPHHDDPPGFDGQLNKIYLLREYHRRGLGRRLLGHVARRFLARGIGSMVLFGDAHNPSNGFYEALGAERLFSPAGEFHGGYGWRDLARLADTCPVE
jgi:ribosomal protein S18 acetylase RimI-like enzyme